MGIFLYYLPGVARHEVNRERLIAAGLSAAFADLLASPGAVEPRLTCCEVRNAGPDGGHGVIVGMTPVAGELVQPVGHYPQRQTWEHGGGYWLGTDNEAPPTPEGLRRPELITGYEHTLGDRNVWTCPIVRRCFVHPMVPRAYRRRGGELVGVVVPEYREIWERSAKWASKAYSGQAMPVVELFDDAALCLGLNYRVGSEEVGRLSLLDDRTIDKVLESAIDAPWLVEALGDPQKKTVVERIIRDLASSSPGPEDSCPDTPPVEPT